MYIIRNNAERVNGPGSAPPRSRIPAASALDGAWTPFSDRDRRVVTGLLDGKVAVITGGARGLGLAIVRAFAEAGAVGLAIDLPGAGLGRGLPPEFTLHAADVTSEADMAAAVSLGKERFGRLDVVMANAGLVPPWRETEGLNLSEWDRVFAVNVRGVAATLKHAVPAMKAGGGSIIVMCSINSWRAHPRQMLYTATKHAALGIVRAAALDLGRYGIRVNGIGPGPIATEALLGRIRDRASAGGPAEEDALDAMASETALGRMATKQDVAKTALFLASDLSSGITGRLLPVDAGLLP